MSKERPPIDLKDPTNPIQMRRLLRSFENEKWKYDQYWVNQDGEFYMTMESPGGNRRIEYIDRGKGPGGSCVEMEFWDDMALVMIFRQEVSKRPNRIENHLIVAPFKDEYFNPEWGSGVHYWPDGKMEPLHNIKGMPKKIDMEATIMAFLDQVIAGKFGRPQLIRPEK